MSLIQKYNVPGPRYTSYPTVPYWDESHFSLSKWKKSRCKYYLSKTNGNRSYNFLKNSGGIPLYVQGLYTDTTQTVQTISSYDRHVFFRKNLTKLIFVDILRLF